MSSTSKFLIFAVAASFLATSTPLTVADSDAGTVPQASGTVVWDTRTEFAAGVVSSTAVIGDDTSGAVKLAQTGRWSQISPSGSPSAREGHIFVYDESAEKFLLFGGRSGGIVHRDTWLYDQLSQTWTEVPTVDPPPARAFAAATYDAARQKVVMFGGSDQTAAPLGDTWEYDVALNRWTQTGGGSGPSARAGAAMAFDQEAGATVLFGGETREGWTVGSASGFGPFSSIAVDSGGKPHLSFIDSPDTLKYATYVGTGGTGCSTSAWTCTTIDSAGSTGIYSSIAVNPAGQARISYFDITNLNLKYAAFVGSAGTGCATAAWTCTTVDSNGDVGKYSSLALDSAGNPQISYLNDTTDDLRHARFVGAGGTGCASAAWTCTTVDSAGAYGQFSSVGLDSSGNAHISYYAATPDLDLRYARYVGAGGTGCASAAWSCLAIDTAGSTGTWTSLALDLWGIPWISYYNGSGADLKVARRVASGGTGCSATSAWDCTTVDLISGSDTSIVMDSSGNAKVSYLNGPSGHLRLAEHVGSGGVGCASAAWSCSILDGGGDAGAETSIDIGPDGAVWVSHLAPSSFGVKVTKRGPSDETWTLGSSWANMTPSTKPSPRAGHWMTYDPGEKQVLMGGGTRGGGELWSATGGGSFWTLKDAEMFPEAKGLPGAVFDPLRSTLLVSMAAAPGVAETVAATGNVGGHASIEVDPSGAPHIAYMRADGINDLYLADFVGTGGAGCASTEWQCGVVASTGTLGQDSSLVYSTAGDPRISSREGASANLHFAEYLGAGGVGCATPAWNCTIVDSAAFVVSYTSLALDSGGVPHISYHDGAPNYNLKFAERVGSGGTGCATVVWTCTVVDSAVNVGLYSSLALDAAGNPHISYYDSSNFNLKFAEYVGAGGTGCATAAWKCTVVDSTGVVGWYTSIALDAWGNPRISYHDATNLALKFAWYVGSGGTGCASAEWNCIVVDSDSPATAPGWYGSLAIDSRGDTVIVHHDDTNRDLRIAEFVGRGGTGCDIPSWTCRTLEATGDTGWHASIDTDSADGRHIAYYQSSLADLKYIRFSGERTADTTWTYARGTATAHGSGYPGPPPRTLHGMAHDSVLDATLMFGGSTADGAELGDLWAWSQLAPLGSWTSLGVDAGARGGREGSSSPEPVRWTQISWTPLSQPVGSARFQIATNDDNATWSYVGPDGTGATFYTLPGGPLSASTVGRYASVRLWLDTGSGYLGPGVDQISLGWEPLGPVSARVISPNGGEDWIYGRTYPIVWTCFGDLGATPVSLAYSTNSGDSWTSITSATANDGTYNWTVPNYDTPNAMVRSTCADLAGRQSADTSDASFAIDPPPSMAVQFSSPLAGEVWAAGGHTVSWDPTYLSGPVDLDFTVDAGVSWSPIVRRASNSGSVPWELPPLNSRASQVRISGVDKDGVGLTSTGPFFVIDSTPPVLSGLRSTAGTAPTFTVEITVTDNFEVRQVTLNVARRGVDGFVSVPMERAGDRFFAAIEPAEGIGAYYVSATDGANTDTTPIHPVAVGTSISPAAAAVISSMSLLLGVGSVLVMTKMGYLHRGIRAKSTKHSKK